MKIVIAKTAGFCMGVRRAVDTVLDASNSTNDPICTYGPLIHNPQVLDLLKDKGVPVINDIPDKGIGTVLVRAHGVPPESKSGLKDAGFKVIDATCPRVIKVQSIIRRYAKKGYDSIIVGDFNHPEVVGLNGYAEGRGHVVSNMDAICALPQFDKAIVVAQTTLNMTFYEEVKKWVKKTHHHYEIFDTICDSTEKRQSEIIKLAEIVDAVVVVGGKNSGNTKRLAEIVSQAGKKVWHIEDVSELDIEALSQCKKVAITAGASTPNWIINKVYKYLESEVLFKQSPTKQKLSAFIHFLLRTNLYLAVGAGCLCYACSKLQDIENSFVPAVIAMLYTLSMHILNHLYAIHADRFNDPDRADFYENHKVTLALLASMSGAAGLFLTYFHGIFPFTILLIMSLLGLSYNLSLIPKFIFQGKYQKLRDIPGSKTVLITLAWGVVTAILPALYNQNGFSFATIPAFLLSTGLVFARTVFFDMLDMQGDRIVGQETLPIILGDKKTLKLLKQILYSLLIVLPVSSLLYLVSGLGLFLCIYPLLMLGVLYLYEKENIFYGLKLELVIESHLILAGIIAFIWSMI